MKEIPMPCRICKYILEDEDFIEEFNTKYVCSFDEDINPKLLGFGCEEFKIGKWALAEFLKALINEKYTFLCTMMCGEIKLEDMKPCKDPKDPTIVCPVCGNCTWYIVPKKEEEKEIERN